MKTRLFIIICCVLLMLSLVFLIGTAMKEERKEAPPASMESETTPSIPIEKGVFVRATQAMDYQNMPESKRSLSTYYNNRAYPGAPPSIPHPLISEKGIGGKTCLQCHQNGGYTPQFDAFAPVTPHPEMLNCRQCHLPAKTSGVFKDTRWEKISPPPIRQAAMPGAPPVIPHTLDMRSNCLSCHAGPGAPKEIRVSHPERVNCRQCHLPAKVDNIFVKPHGGPPPQLLKDSTLGHSLQKIHHTNTGEISEWIRNNTN